MAHAKSNHGADIAKDGLSDFGGELIKVLVVQGQAKAVFAGFGQDGGEAVSGEVMELVNEEVAVFAATGRRLPRLPLRLTG